MKKIIILVGPTSVGKTVLAIELAQKFNAEIICADSLLVYKDFNIGTAKPFLEERKGISHHLIDIVNPMENFTAFDFCEKAKMAISDIQNRGKNVIVTGGSGFYIKALMCGMFQAPCDKIVREELEVETIERGLVSLYEELQKVDPKSGNAIHSHDKYRIIRALEVFRLSGKPFSAYRENHISKEDNPYIKMGIHIDRSELHKNIERRTQEMLKKGLVDEVSKLMQKYPLTCKLFYSVGYQETVDFLKERLTVLELEQNIIIRTRQLARKQLTWFRGTKDIQWFSPKDVCSFLAKGAFNFVEAMT